MMKKNQIMITALAIMIAIAGYLNFAGSRISEEEIMETGADSAVTAKEDAPDTEDTQVASLFEISDEDMEAAENYDIAIEKSRFLAGEGPVFVFGSLYLAGGIREKLKIFYN